MSISQWQNELREYVIDHGNGDVNMIRARSADAGRPQFSVIGHPNAAEAADVHGLLLGRKIVNGRDWNIFLVAAVHKRQTTDVRLAMLLDDAALATWMVSPPDREALALYNKRHDDAWRAKYPGRAEPPPGSMEFPQPEDVFRLEASGDTVSVVEEKSNARWTLAVKDSARTAR